MKKQNKTNKYFPFKSYVYGLIIAIVIILLIWYLAAWYKVKNEDRLIKSYLVNTNTVTYEIDDLKEIVQVLKESPSDYFIYISYTNNEGIYKLEKKLKKIIDAYELKDAFYYININDYLDDQNIYNELNNIFSTNKIKNAPCILYFEDNELIRVIQKNDGIFNYNDFTNLLKENGYEKMSH